MGHPILQFFIWWMWISVKWVHNVLHKMHACTKRTLLSQIIATVTSCISPSRFDLVEHISSILALTFIMSRSLFCETFWVKFLVKEEQYSNWSGLIQISLKFHFTENGWSANSPKIAPCAHSPKLAGMFFYFQRISKNWPASLFTFGRCSIFFEESTT